MISLNPGLGIEFTASTFILLVTDNDKRNLKKKNVDDENSPRYVNKVSK